ncbi:PadR family transcriptional regulator [Micromonospora sp. 4G57]|uniref:PadR family transcriptional regulator n=1 Tax=Micromonospora sicca TaxID=2202420 RepID=A0ABU5JDG1_9ACTN|nr:MULTISPECIES: PadR family transcriptional regulator [unclassified Micromonospora]MDZ5442059.1 PadR family transcriptional regulator [Micromonospora sp. 4G57]MDZ5490514.1 PadR family transcriptional regulator [Micromonospora sp. 4G53]
MPDRPLNATAASLLGFLHDGPMTGWDLVTVAEQRIGAFWSLTQSQVYRELSAMAAAGLVRAGERGRRDRQPYEITEAGRAAFAEWAARPPAEESIRFPLLLTVLFGRHLPADRMAAFLAQHRAAHAERLAGYEQVAAALPEEADAIDPYSVATLRFGLAYERAVLDWFDGLPPALRDPAAGAGSTPGTGGRPTGDAED